MLKELQEFGLSEKEARVYLAALEIGKATADELSKQANVKRPTTYVRIESLIEKGLMSKFDEGKKTYFVPESPEHLRRLFEGHHEALHRRERELEKLLPDLKQLFAGAGDRPRVRFFEGREGVRTMREEFLKAKEKEIRIIFSQDILAGIYSQKELDDYSDRRAQKGIRSWALYTRHDGEFAGEHPPLTERRFVPEGKLYLESDIIIYDNNVAMTALRGRPFGVIIESKEMAASMRSLFEVLWNVAGSIHGRAMT